MSHGIPSSVLIISPHKYQDSPQSTEHALRRMLMLVLKIVCQFQSFIAMISLLILQDFNQKLIVELSLYDL